MAIIIFNGRTYNNLEEMPPNERKAYEQMMNIFMDANGNGIPDFLEGDMAQNVMTAFTSNLVINGKAYGGINEMPEDMRTRVVGAFEKMAELGIVTKTTSPMMMQVKNSQVSREPQISSKPFISGAYSSAIQEDKGSNVLLWILAGVVLFLCLAISVFVIFYFMQ